MGISFEPSATSKPLVVNTTISNDTTDDAGGILIQPGSSGLAVVQLTGAKLARNKNGLRVFDRSRVSVANSVVTGNSTGVIAECATACEINVRRSEVSGNQTGVRTYGALGTIRLSDVGVFDNIVGLSHPTGAIVSYGNNDVSGNTTDGAPTSTISQQ